MHEKQDHTIYLVMQKAKCGSRLPGMLTHAAYFVIMKVQRHFKGASRRHGNLTNGVHLILKKAKSGSMHECVNAERSYTIKIASFQSIMQDCTVIFSYNIIWTMSFMMVTLTGLLHRKFTGRKKTSAMSLPDT